MHIPTLSGHAPALDRFGQPLAPGDLVTYSPADPAVFVVQDVHRVLDRNAPPGTIRVTLTATATLMLTAGAPAAGVHRIGYLGDDKRTPMIGSAVRQPGNVGQGPTDPPQPVDVPVLVPDPDPSPAPGGPRLVLPPG